MRKRTENTVYPAPQFLYWLHKWGINARQLNEAIIETGSIDTCKVRDFLLKKGILISVFGLFYYSGESFRRFFKSVKKGTGDTLVSGNAFVSIPKIPFMRIYSN